MSQKLSPPEIDLFQFNQSARYNIAGFLRYCKSHNIDIAAPYEEMVGVILKYFDNELKQGFSLGTLNGRKCGIIKYFSALKRRRNPGNDVEIIRWMQYQKSIQAATNRQSIKIEQDNVPVQRALKPKLDLPLLASNIPSLRPRHDSHTDISDVIYISENIADINSFGSYQDLLSMQQIESVDQTKINKLISKVHDFQSRLYDNQHKIALYEAHIFRLMNEMRTSELERNAKEQLYRNAFNVLHKRITEIEKQFRPNKSE
eukprot:NODE_938_length_2926_cov_0.411390.p1 type:complete len:259 gc:universal NODE_938_length_2926_cov_0.411390:770-1546(+)